MDIMIDQNLRELRTAKGCRQDDLADFLGVSHQTVSKWERGENMPDLTLLPSIASFYDVTVDDLLGVGELRKREQITAYHAEAKKYKHSGEAEKLVEVWRRAVGEFPNDMECLTELMASLSFACNDKTDEAVEEILAIGKRILRESTDDCQRYTAIQLLSLNLIWLGRYDEAEAYIGLLPNAYITSNYHMSTLLTAKNDVEKGKATIFENILTYFELLRGELYNLCCLNRGDYPYCVKLHELYLKLADVIFDDGFYGAYGCRLAIRHYWLAKLYLNLYHDEETARYHLEKAAKCAMDYDRLPDEFTYRATVFGEGWQSGKQYISKNYTATECALLLHSLDGKGLDDPVFDRFRACDWFRALIADLEKGG